MLGDALQPFRHTIESSHRTDIVSYYNTIGLLVESLRHRVESLMTSGVPNFHSDRLVVLGHVLARDKVQSERALVLVLKLIFIVLLDY